MKEHEEGIWIFLDWFVLEELFIPFVTFIKGPLTKRQIDWKHYLINKN